LAVRGHTFVLKGDSLIIIDGGKFVYEEALQLVKLLNSRSPFAHFSAAMNIAERNGTLRLVVLALIGIIIVAVFILAER
jgi:hypothetical protein